MKVICFYWQGDRWQEKGYEEDPKHTNLQHTSLNKLGMVDTKLVSRYVNNLYLGVKRFIDVPFDFICFTNEPLEGIHKDVELRPFKQVTKHGVLPRLYMFSEEAGLFGHQVLCLDLDIIIVGPLQEFIAYDGEFCARAKFKPGEEWKLDGDIMSFRACKETEDKFWKPFINNIEASVELTQGRERYWMRHVAVDTADMWTNVAPTRRIVSYKRHVRAVTRRIDRPPKRVSIISCHGSPRPHQITKLWIKNYWK